MSPFALHLATMSRLADSSMTIPSDSEIYEATVSHDPSFDRSPGSDSDSHRNDDAPMILYNPPTMWGLLRGAAINLFLPFINGLMLGFGELFAHEIAFQLGWSRTKVRSPGLLFPRRASGTVFSLHVRLLAISAACNTYDGHQLTVLRLGVPCTSWRSAASWSRCGDPRRPRRAEKKVRPGVGHVHEFRIGGSERGMTGALPLNRLLEQ